jgi:predicted porin
MKKSLFAVAAATAFAGAAQAQSSVTVYGILDVGYIGGNVRTGSSGVTGLQGTYNSIGSSAESTSRLGFRGTEDLGGGLNAFFTIETGLQPTNATVSTFNNRQTFVGLGKKGLGQMAFGTQYTPIHTAIAITSAGQQNNMVGDVIYPIAPANNGNTGISQHAGTSNTDSYTIRTANMIKLTSENVAGFVGTAFYTMNDVNTTERSTTSGGVNNQNGWGVGLNFTWQKLVASANYQSLSSNQSAECSVTAGCFVTPTSYPNGGSAATVTSNLNNPAIWSGAAGGANIRDNQFYVAAAYDFGILKAYAQYINRKATSQLDSSNYLSRTAQQLGIRGNATKTIEYWASIGNGRFDSYGTTHPTVNFTGYQVGSNYWLSKRTNMYAIFGSTQQSSSTNQAQPSVGANNYALGVRHTF